MEGKLMTYTETTEFYHFILNDGTEQFVGKQSESNPSGASSYNEAIEILLLNFPDLII